MQEAQDNMMIIWSFNKVCVCVCLYGGWEVS